MVVAVQRDYDNAKNRDVILEELEKNRTVTSKDETSLSQLPGQQASESEKAKARKTIADETPVRPGDELPDLTETFELPFRGRIFEFSELGDSLIDAYKAQQDQNLESEEDMAERGVQFADFLHNLLGEKCTHPAADAEYWSKYDLHREDVDGLMDLFERLVEKIGGVSPQELEDVETFRNE